MSLQEASLIVVRSNEAGFISGANPGILIGGGGGGGVQTLLSMFETVLQLLAFTPH